MTMDTDYVIVKEIGNCFLFWGGRFGWCMDYSGAHIYKNRVRAESACDRNAWRFSDDVGYLTMDEALDRVKTITAVASPVAN